MALQANIVHHTHRDHFLDEGSHFRCNWEWVLKGWMEKGAKKDQDELFSVASRPHLCMRKSLFAIPMFGLYKEVTG